MTQPELLSVPHGEDEDPFGPDEAIPSPRKGEGIRPTAAPGTEEHRKQLLDYAMSGHTDLDSYAASKAKEAGKGRRKRPNFKPYTHAKYKALGFALIAQEEYLRTPIGAVYSMDVDGLWDSVWERDGRKIAVQDCALDDMGKHLRTMCSQQRTTRGVKRVNLERWMNDPSAECRFEAYHQPKGRGTRWQAQTIVITWDMIHGVDKRRRKAK